MTRITVDNNFHGLVFKGMNYFGLIFIVYICIDVFEDSLNMTFVLDKMSKRVCFFVSEAVNNKKSLEERCSGIQKRNAYSRKLTM